MAEINVTIVPIGKVDLAEVEAVAVRIAKILTRPIELRRPSTVPRTSEDAARGQHRAAGFLAESRLALPRLAVDKIITPAGEKTPEQRSSLAQAVQGQSSDPRKRGESDPEPRAGARPATPPVPSSTQTTTAIPKPNPSAVIFITDVDLFTPNAEGVFGELDARNKAAVISIRRLREAHYRRKPDPAKQRAREVKLVLQTIGRLRGLADCRDPRCVMAPTGALADIDLKNEKFCAACSRHLMTGVFRI